MIANLVRKNILELQPYSTARHEFSEAAEIFLDANENTFGSPIQLHNTYFNRYPDPLQLSLKKEIALLKNVVEKNIFLGNGSDEAIDVLLRVFCEPGKDNIIICPPTYGMYKVCANINNVAVQEVALTASYQLNIEKINEAINEHTKIIFICSPNNPTGNDINEEDIIFLLTNFNGIVVIDEAYIDFSDSQSFITKLDQFKNLVVLQTFSKAWGLAALRIGMAFSNTTILHYMNNVKYPYNINEATQSLTLMALKNEPTVASWIKQIKNERTLLTDTLVSKKLSTQVYPSNANFILAKFTNAPLLYKYLCSKGIVVRDRSNIHLCDDCLRITIGTIQENQQLIETIQSFYN